MNFVMHIMMSLIGNLSLLAIAMVFAGLGFRIQHSRAKLERS